MLEQVHAVRRNRPKRWSDVDPWDAQYQNLHRWERREPILGYYGGSPIPAGGIV